MTVLGYQRPNATARCHILKGSAVNLDLSCSAFDPGDTLPDYGAFPPTFSRRLTGQAAGIRVFRGGIGSIGLIKSPGTPSQDFDPGANVFPLDTGIDRRVNPSFTNNVNEPGGLWQSPTNWISIAYSGSRPKYARFQNEFLGSRLIAITNDTPSIRFSDADTSVINCNQFDYEDLFPTRKANQGGLAGSRLGMDANTYLDALPNPASNLIKASYRLALDPEDKPHLVILDLYGDRILGPIELDSSSGERVLDVSSLHAGIYTLRLSSKRKHLSKRVAIIK